MSLDYKTAYARYGRMSGLDQKYFDGANVRAGYSTVASQQNPNPVYTYRHKTSKKGGGFTYGDQVNVYKKDAPVAAPAPPPAPAPAPPPPPPTPQPKPPAPVVHSPEIQQAKERVNKYQSDILSGKVSEEIYGKSNSRNTVKSGNVSEDVYGKDYSKDTYIANSSSNRNQIYDFSQNAFGNNQR